MMIRAAFVFLLFSISANAAEVTMPQARSPSGQKIPAQPVVILNADGTASTGGGGGGGGGDASAANQTAVQADPGSDATKAVAVQGVAGGKAIPVSVSTLPLPTGASTSANQTTGNSSLASIVTNTTGLATASNQTTANSSLSSVDTKLTSQATGAKQDTGNTSLSSIDTKLSSQATAAKQDTAAGKLDTIHTDTGTTIPAKLDTGNASLSSVDTKLTMKGYEFQVTDTPTVQNAAYASGNCVGGFRTLTVSRVASGGIVISTFSVRSITGITPTLQIYLFSANPSASTCTDKSTFTINSADVDKVIPGGVFLVGLAQPVGSTPSFGSGTNLALSANANASSQIYYAIVATGAMTPGSTTDLHVASSGNQD